MQGTLDFEVNAETVIGSDELRERMAAGKRLKVKLGVDPTRPDLTFGHLVVFNKLRQFQEAGHEAILIIGDYTAMIGDPSGRSSTRPVLTEGEVKENSRTYLEQAFKVLDREKTTIRYNSEWFAAMHFADCLELSRKMTVARMLERDDFSKRYREGAPISIVEFLYPLIQGYDSLVLEADVELGGNDQLFNMLVGRALQKDAGKPEQAVITMPLLVGLDGERKMSKSYGNYIAFNDLPNEMFGKVMSVSDDTMWQYFRLLLGWDDAAIAEKKAGHPMEVKKGLAVELLSRFHSPDEAAAARQHFEMVFSRNELPEDMVEVSLGEHFGENEASVSLLLAKFGGVASRKEAVRLIEQGGVKVDGEKVTDKNASVDGLPGGRVLQAGKRVFLRVVP